MGIREKIAERSQPYLAPGESVHWSVYCQTGPTPWLGALTGILLFFLTKFRLIVVTDQSVYVFRSSRWRASPKEVLARLPRQTRLGPIEGRLWGKITVNGERTWVHRRFHKDIEGADAEIGSAPGSPSVT